MGTERALWIRQTALGPGKIQKHARFSWLEPPSFAGSLTVADIVQGATPQARTAILTQYVSGVWRAWEASCAATIAQWYAHYIDATWH